jgi:hypothetical protein
MISSPYCGFVLQLSAAALACALTLGIGPKRKAPALAEALDF